MHCVAQAQDRARVRAIVFFIPLSAALLTFKYPI